VAGGLISRTRGQFHLICSEQWHDLAESANVLPRTSVRSRLHGVVYLKAIDALVEYTAASDAAGPDSYHGSAGGSAEYRATAGLPKPPNMGTDSVGTCR
jgi:hypothetical protein